MSTAPHHDDDNNQDRNHDDERAAIEEAAAQLRVPVATLRYWRTHHTLRRTQPGRRPGSGSTGV